jgi:hypothetical protein
LLRTASFRFALQRWPDEFDTVVSETDLELAAGVALVSDDGLHAATIEQAGIMVEHVESDVSFIGFRVG